MRIFIVVFCCINLLACNSTYTPKPKGYFKIDFPKEHQYQSFDLAGFPYSFDYPTYAKILRDTLFFDEKAENEFWVNVDLPTHQGRIHLSYKDLRNNDINKMIDDAFRLSSKHTSKATNIDEQSLVTQNGIHGMLFSVHGDAATPYQFFLTDSTKHFLRGALYFESSPNEDSMRMVHEFFKKDIDQLINTLKWK
jgi:gliding motility-associated lipoprotein GldD